MALYHCHCSPRGSPGADPDSLYTGDLFKTLISGRYRSFPNTAIRKTDVAIHHVQPACAFLPHRDLPYGYPYGYPSLNICRLAISTTRPACALCRGHPLWSSISICHLPCGHPPYPADLRAFRWPVYGRGSAASLRTLLCNYYPPWPSISIYLPFAVWLMAVHCLASLRTFSKSRVHPGPPAFARDHGRSRADGQFLDWLSTSGHLPH